MIQLDPVPIWYDRENVPMKQYGCPNNGRIMATLVDMPMWTGKFHMALHWINCYIWSKDSSRKKLPHEMSIPSSQL